MPNPIYILQLTDWHLQDFKTNLTDWPQDLPLEQKQKKVEEAINEKARVEKAKLLLRENLRAFLKLKGRSHIELLSVTGDMVDKNGLSTNSKNHQLAVDLVNDIARDFFPDDPKKRKIFCTPGNHDIDDNACSAFLKKDEIKAITTNPKIPNYLIVDDHTEDLKTFFKNYKEFAEQINASNKEYPFHGSSTIDFEGSKLFISWFNTAWLSIGKKFGEIAHEKAEHKNDSENITVGKKINNDIITAFKEFEEQTQIKSFTMSISHHFPRFLNWFDKNDIDKNDLDPEDNDCELQKRIEPGECIYSHFKKYNVVLNGHTHGRLFDKPFCTPPGIATGESKYVNKETYIYEVDLARNFFIIYTIPLEEEIDLNNLKRRIVVFNDDEYIEDIWKNYSNTDLYNDMFYNGKFSKGEDIDDLKYNPLSSLNLELETQSLKAKLNSFGKGMLNNDKK